MGEATFESSEALVDILQGWLVGKPFGVMVVVVGELFEFTRVTVVPLAAEPVEEDTLSRSLV